MRNHIWRMLFIALVSSMFFTITPNANATGERYVTFSKARGLFGEASNCKLVSGAVNTMEEARVMASYGLSGSANAIVKYVNDGAGFPNDRACKDGKGNLYLSKADLRVLRDTYGWNHVTSGLLYRDMTSLSYAEKIREACGARRQMQAWGHNHVTGYFAAANPGDRPVDEPSIRAARECGFLLVRDYGSQLWQYQPKADNGDRIPTNLRYNLSPNRLYRTLSLNGGNCPDYADCGNGGQREYALPGKVIYYLSQSPANSHMIIQNYRLVENDKAGQWKCSGDSETHWTREAEMYCFADMRKIWAWVSKSNYINKDVYTVAQRWGLN